MLELEHHIQLLVLAFGDVFQRVFRRHHRRFTELERIVILDDLPVFHKVFVDVGAGGIVLHTAHYRQREAVGQPFALADVGDDVFAEAVDAHIQPEFHHLFHFLAHGGIVVVEVGLLHREQMEVILPPLLVPLPRVARECGHPVVGELFPVLAPAGTPDVIILVFRVLRRALFEPFVLVGRMVDDEVHNDFHTPFVCAVEHCFEIFHRAVFGVDVVVVRYVVAVVLLRRYIKRRKPYCIHAQAFDVIQLAEHAFEVAHSVAVAVAETARPNLIDGQFFVPGLFHNAIILPFLGLTIL